MVYPGLHIRNCRDKSDTFTVEGVNADLQHYIPILARRSRCFARKIETLRAVLEVFVEAYNKFGVAKMKFRQGRDTKSRELPFSVLNFLQSMRAGCAPENRSAPTASFTKNPEQSKADRGTCGNAWDVQETCARQARGA